ncbi:MAG TPA: ABC transporter permease, partial [Blastocatellia bacterium]
MSWWTRLWRRKKMEEDLEKELRFHLEQHTADLIAQGLAPEEARRRARLALGGPEQVKEQCRDSRGTRWLDDLAQDIRYGARMLMKSSGFTLVAVITLGLGIGANTTIFSAMESVILHPFALPNQNRLMVIYERNLDAGVNRTWVAPRSLRDWREQSQAFEKFESLSVDGFDLTGADQQERAERVFGYRVSAGFFSALGVKPLLGRAFQPDEDTEGREQVIVLNHGLWERRYGSDPNTLGQSITLNGKAYTVIGVMPKDFNFPYNNGEFWTPFVFPERFMEDRQKYSLSVFGLLKPGVSPAQGAAEIRELSLLAQRRYPDTNIGVDAFAVGLKEDFTRDTRAYLPFTLGAVAFVLLIACANVANLLMARGPARQKELAARMALGATRRRVMRHLLTESLLLSMLGGLAGLAFSVWGIIALANGLPQNYTRYIPGWERLGINAWAMGFTMSASLLTGILCGLLPAWQATGTDLNEILKEGARGATSGGRNRWRNALVVAEVALSLTLLVGAGLLIRSFILILRTDLGFNPDNAMMTRVILAEDRYSQPEQIAGFYRELSQRVAALPGVAAAGGGDGLPLGGWSSNYFQIAGRPPAPGYARQTVLSLAAAPGYFAAIGTPLREGRLFTDQDDAAAPRVALVNEAFASRYLAGGSAIGQRFSLDDGPPNEIVGVVANTISANLSDRAQPGVYLPFAQRPNRNIALIVRGKKDQNVAQVGAAIRRELDSMDAGLRFNGYIMLSEFVRYLIAPRRVITVILVIFASLALVMATVGLYAVMSFAVTQRTHEIGIRMAMGAQTRDVFVIIVKQGLRLIIPGIIIGLIGAFAVTRLLSQLLYGVTASDTITYAMVAGLLLATALAACIAPARRAMKVDP